MLARALEIWIDAGHERIVCCGASEKRTCEMYRRLGVARLGSDFQQVPTISSDIGVVFRLPPIQQR